MAAGTRHTLPSMEQAGALIMEGGHSPPTEPLLMREEAAPAPAPRDDGAVVWGTAPWPQPWWLPFACGRRRVCCAQPRSLAAAAADVARRCCCRIRCAAASAAA